jgi:pSer/pThr/pTyr-binding forkhead associated (FHA) protein
VYAGAGTITPTPVLHWAAGDAVDTELELVREGVVVRVIPVRDAVTIGRDLGNHVVLADPQVSGHHAVVQRGPDGVVVRDLGSTNGTTVNGAVVAGARKLAHGDELGLGTDVALRVRQVTEGPSGTWVLRDLAAGTLHLLEDDHLHIGSGEGAAIRLPAGPDRAATLLSHGDGQLWLGTPDGDRELAEGDSFEVAGSTFRVELLAQNTLLVPTTRPARTTRFPYRLDVSLSPAGAVLRDRTTERECRWDAEVRVSLLYQLAKQLREDRAARVVPAMAGWCHDEDLMVGVWGREALTGAASRFSVLLHRVRKDLEAAGLDPWCLEKRRGATRLCIDEP